ncbi:MAG: HNH endonuclease signature motif containing protein, partial [Actinomycetota bacterium]
VVDADPLAGRAALDPRAGCCELAGLGPVSPDLARTLACDAAIGRVLVRGRLEVVDLGRRTRMVSPALRRLLEVRDGTCVEPGCDVPGAWCDVHHVVPWWAHGPTSPANTELRCRHHHLRRHRDDPVRFRRIGPGARGDPTAQGWAS